MKKTIPNPKVKEDAAVEEAGRESFPASDAPSYGVETAQDVDKRAAAAKIAPEKKSRPGAVPK